MNPMDETPLAEPRRRARRPGLLAKDRPWLNALLFALTGGTIFLMGLDWSAGFLGATHPFRDVRVLELSAVYTIVLLLILGAHEMGHFLACRRFGLSATWPFFIPAPTLVGTMGAFIRIRSPITRRRQLFDIGAAGPLAGFVLAVPALGAGLALSRVVPALPRDQSLIFGEPLLVKLFSAVLIGKVGPGYDLLLHPVAFAGWVGLLVTALNLFPVGQLDGGHIVHALFGRRSRPLGPLFVGLFLALAWAFWAGWLVWAALILVIGFRHPPVWDEDAPLGRTRTLVAVLVLIIFAVSFIPAPIQGYSLRELLKPGSGPFF